LKDGTRGRTWTGTLFL